MIDIGLLGPLRVVRDGTPVEVGGTRIESLLALLALRAGSPAGVEFLIDGLWGEEAPDGASTTLRTYVARLRAGLGDGVPIEHVPAGYMLAIPADAVDVVRFERLVREGRDLHERNRHRRAAAVLREALALWRDRPFAGLVETRLLGAEAVRLDELRMHALESRIEADLELDRAAELIDELEGHVAAHPFREPLWRLLMLALYRAGRQADALEAYHRARSALDEQLGIEPGADLRELESAILRQDVPAPAMRGATAIGLPVSLTSFVGRAQDIGGVRSLLGRARLVTLVGIGGVGKTRLAIEVARRAIEDGADGVAFVDLATLADPALLPAHVATSLGLREDPANELASALADRVGATDLLLVLDNCEHLRDAAASLARALLATSSNLRILATSREILDVDGEAPYPVPPLGMEDAVRLLVDRATLTRHDLRVDDAAYATADRICRELDGLPLAIELAAARTKALSLDEIAGRLRDRFQFLVSWRRLSSARHRTLREAMDWSFELLSPDEQRLLTRLSVFPAGATLESVAEVCIDGDRDGAGRLIERLVEASLVNPIEGVRGTRYRLLETVRQYAGERLPASEVDDLHRRHAERVRSIAISTNLSVEGRITKRDFEFARDELPSIRAAIQRAAADPALAIEIACALELFWVTHHPREGIAMFTALLANDGVPDLLRARALRCLGGCTYITGSFEAGEATLQQSLAIFRRLGRNADVAHILMLVGMEARRVGERPRARALLDEAATIGGDERYVEDVHTSLYIGAGMSYDEGRLEESVAMLERAADLAAQAGDSWWQGFCLLILAEQSIDLGRPDAGLRAGREALTLTQAIGDRQQMVFCVAVLALYAAATGHLHRAGRLWGGIEAEVERGGPLGQWELEREAYLAKAVAAAGGPLEDGVADGRLLGFEAVIAEALSPA